MITLQKNHLEILIVILILLVSVLMVGLYFKGIETGRVKQNEYNIKNWLNENCLCLGVEWLDGSNVNCIRYDCTYFGRIIKGGNKT